MRLSSSAQTAAGCPVLLGATGARRRHVRVPTARTWLPARSPTGQFRRPLRCSARQTGEKTTTPNPVQKGSVFDGFDVSSPSTPPSTGVGDGSARRPSAGWPHGCGHAGVRPWMACRPHPSPTPARRGPRRRFRSDGVKRDGYDAVTDAEANDRPQKRRRGGVARGTLSLVPFFSCKRKELAGGSRRNPTHISNQKRHPDPRQSEDRHPPTSILSD